MTEGKLSIPMVIKNEERYLHHCIENIKSLADEIVIFADRTSTDKTVSICKELQKRYPRKIVLHLIDTRGRAETWRERSVRACRHEWIYWADPDEHFTDKLKKEIKKTIKSRPHQNAFFVERQEYFLYRGTFINLQMKLLRKDKMLAFPSSIHSEPKMEGEVGKLKERLLHYSPQEIDDLLAKIARTTRFEILKIKEGPLWWIFTKTVIIRSIVYFLYLYFYRGAVLSGFPGLLYSYYAGPYYSWCIFARYYQNKIDKEF